MPRPSERTGRLALAAVLALTAAACARPSAGKTLVIAMAGRPAAFLTVRSAAMGPAGRIAAANSAYGANRSLPVSWSAAPAAKAYAIVLEDPDAPGAAPFVHWLVWNIPANVTRLAEGAPPPASAMQGSNGTGAAGYHGPHPPSGTHHYHLEVFALDRPLGLAAGANRDALAAALRGHVIAAGETIGLYSAPAH
jgi:Raf kinase inhibitor-like YbhB/YbcL family protein